ncbi:MAG TPA: NAD(P)H-hydrate dehydratase [Solirubrobacteraceae bacterium]|jgi:NAD(P)H-hydrate epimerase|nr:NAD(P)H-hydrate dehydratase [Solirubrobacteraceae bacterium]
MSLESWLEPLPDAAQMRATDAWAIEERGVPSIELMERAGAGLATLAAELAGDGCIVVVAGKGNNAGDGLVAARLLREAGRSVDVVSAGELSALAGDAAVNLERLPGEAPSRLDAGITAAPALVIDALLGTGASGAPRGEIAAAIAAIAACGAAAVLAADVPSGVDASSGEVAGDAVAASATATFHAAKLGLWIEPGRSHAGDVRVIDIGIPDGGPAQAEIGLIRDRVLDLVPRRERGSTKFTSGRVLVAGGSAGLTGAPSLAALAAARAGAGYVTVCVPSSLSLVFETRLLEAMTLAVADADGAHSADGVAAVVEAAAARGGALVVGPGLGRSDGARDFAHGVLETVEVPVVLDADGLNAFAGDAAALRGHAAVLTPHAGELGRLLGVASEEVERSRLRFARDAAALSGGVVVLKGDDTIVAAPHGPVAISPGASAALATAGTGDVLSGVIAAMLAKGLDPFLAACAGVRLHALAGIAAADARGSVEGVIASDVIEALAGVR